MCSIIEYQNYKIITYYVFIFKWNFWVASVNLVFAFVAVWNLAYLGCLFDNSEEEEKVNLFVFIYKVKWCSKMQKENLVVFIKQNKKIFKE